MHEFMTGLEPGDHDGPKPANESLPWIRFWVVGQFEIPKA
jgi:hypothetical protein